MTATTYPTATRHIGPVTGADLQDNDRLLVTYPGAHYDPVPAIAKLTDAGMTLHIEGGLVLPVSLCRGKLWRVLG